ncbi:histidine kinase [Aquiflexum sp. TKW24L]|uniref:sensor histidine kinase n=1 Tax=Aquiflexum sp. TKW24L TaxID=2942212 RepID=UPI0020BEEA57|nr:histidine kinase [Aquiflexum sp. TKW24L]MCL6261414.1 histidine kinase [Aquiflexum sp. TKW24L]
MRKISLNKNQQYWTIQILGWFSLVFVETINYTFFIIREFVWEYVFQFCFLALTGLITSHFYKVLFIKPTIFQKSLSKIWGKALLDTFFITFIMVCLTFIPLVFSAPEFFSTSEFVIHFLGQIMNIARYVVVWIIIYYLFHILDRNRIISQQNLIVENLAKTSELELLKSQLNPHFLFNALNSIKALVLIDTTKAREAIIKLSELLRFTLNYEKTPLINLSDEIDEVVKYLELEKIRFGDRLDVNIDLQAETLDAKVPPAMILTFAENAIKHGITQLPDGGIIEIKSSSNSQTLKIEVSNTGELKENESKGIGLKNSTRRLQNLFGEKAELHLQSKSPDKVSVTIVYPLKYNNHA